MYFYIYFQDEKSIAKIETDINNFHDDIKKYTLQLDKLNESLAKDELGLKSILSSIKGI